MEYRFTSYNIPPVFTAFLDIDHQLLPSGFGPDLLLSDFVQSCEMGATFQCLCWNLCHEFPFAKSVECWTSAAKDPRSNPGVTDVVKSFKYYTGAVTK